MAASKQVHGARAIVSIEGRVVGIWNDISVDWNYDVRSSYILGRFSAAGLTTVGVEPCNIRASGFLVVNHGFFKEGRITNLQDLLGQEYIQLTVLDRESDVPLLLITGCLPTGMSVNLPAKDLATGTNTYIGLLCHEYGNTQAEPTGSTQLPDPSIA